MLHYRKRDALIQRAKHAWGLDREAAERVGEISFEAGFSRHSKAALEKLVPFLWSGITYSEARKAAYCQRSAMVPQAQTADDEVGDFPTAVARLIEAWPRLQGDG